ncbi:MAG: hypothetical protein U0942_12420 [Parvibaculum sp.]|uniref:class I SAM-dependent RNA methyltransferase n=1 Tax=Parvibaculum sp. TaxID=2024848 RepID=UPI002AB92181|nr:hypothetical protein [Parvibaculum sp.]MDZ4382133.1 hypothetical protein [Parvibaculum sp.]
MTEIETLILSLGAQADGIAAIGGETIYIPYVLPGERVRVVPEEGGRASLLKVLESSADRVSPACAHFTRCGGCTLQHMAPAAYAAWKREQVAVALKARGIETEVAPLVAASSRSRRRATLALTRTKKSVTAGYYARGSHDIVLLSECPLVVPEIERFIPRLGDLMQPGLSRRTRASVLVTATLNGLDIAVTGGKPLDGPLRAELGQHAQAADVARLSWDGEILAERRTPEIDLSGLRVTLPVGGFLQPTQEGEAALIALVRGGVGEARRVVDLFAGCGTFSASLAATAAVHAVEGEKPALAALERAVRTHGPGLALKPLTTEARDLARRPLLAEELNKFEAIVVDPPRAGAMAQAEEIAKSKVPVVVSVSCNPATFARDARALLDGGYRLDGVTPVDQFLWSAHVELVGIFRRG